MLSEKAFIIRQRLHLDDKIVTQLLFGSIMPLVNGGPVEMTRHFLSEFVPSSKEEEVGLLWGFPLSSIRQSLMVSLFVFHCYLFCFFRALFGAFEEQFSPSWNRVVRL